MSNFITHLFSSAEYVFAIVTLLGGVIAIHEFGHFIMAKWSGIRVDTFSIGFGPKLFSKKSGETEYVLSLIPLGGFVKIYGQDPEELAKDEHPQPERAFSQKSLLQKLGVLIGGPLFNYLLAIALFSLLAIAGTQKLPPLATRVVYGTPAYKSGLRSGDKILSIDNKSMHEFEEIAQTIAENAEKTVQFQVERDGQKLTLPVPVQKESAESPMGDPSQAGYLNGLEPFGMEPIFATTIDNHPWKIKSGDKILSVNQTQITSWESFEAYLERVLASAPAHLTLSVERDGHVLALESPDLTAFFKKQTKPLTAQEFLQQNGLFTPELFVQEAVRGTPADKAGLKKGDHILSANGAPVYSFENLRETIQSAGEALAKMKDVKQLVALQIERQGKIIDLSSGITATKSKDPLGQSIVTYTVGIVSAGKARLPDNMILERTFNPFVALYRGSKETVNNTITTVVGIKKLAFGEVSFKSVGGPIMIGKLAGETLSSRGWRDFLHIMAIISISLGVFNLLPVPVLDGGYIVFAVVESLRGKPLSQRATQMFLNVGLSLILVLMVFAFYNDISRMLPF